MFQAEDFFHNPLPVRNFTRYEIEGSPTVWFDEFSKGYILSKFKGTTSYLKCHRYTAKRGNIFHIFFKS